MANMTLPRNSRISYLDFFICFKERKYGQDVRATKKNTPAPKRLKKNKFLANQE